MNFQSTFRVFVKRPRKNAPTSGKYAGRVFYEYKFYVIPDDETGYGSDLVCRPFDQNNGELLLQQCRALQYGFARVKMEARSYGEKIDYYLIEVSPEVARLQEAKKAA